MHRVSCPGRYSPRIGRRMAAPGRSAFRAGSIIAPLCPKELSECRMSVKILVADDHEVVRAGLKSLLQGTDLKIIGEAATGEAALRLALKHNPDVVLLDVRMPEGDGLTALGKIKLEKPNLAILIWSAFDNPNYIA